MTWNAKDLRVGARVSSRVVPGAFGVVQEHAVAEGGEPERWLVQPELRGARAQWLTRDKLTVVKPERGSGSTWPAKLR